MDNYLTKDFEGIALKEFKFLQDEYGFSEPMFERNKMYENIAYTKGSLGVLVSFDAMYKICGTYFFDASKGFPPETIVGKSDYYDSYYRCKNMPVYNPKTLNLPDSRKKNGSLVDGWLKIELSNNAKILNKYFVNILKSDVFIYNKQVQKDNYLTKDFEEIALKEFKFLQDEYGFSEPMFERNKMYENIAYTKGSLGVLLSYDALDSMTTLYFFDVSKGFPPDVMVGENTYYNRYENLQNYNPKKLNLMNPHLKNGFLREGGLELDISNNVKVLKAYFDPILKTDTFRDKE